MKKLLFTGASGFLGYNIRPILEISYDVHTIGLTDDDDIKINMAKEVPPINTHYDVVLHAAGKAHVVPKTEEEKQVFFDVNYQGTVNLCKALEKAGIPKSLVFISTVAVYGCEFGELIDEYHPLNGDSPYAKSKIEAEHFLANWCLEHHIVLTILRPSLIAGPNPPGNLGAMVKGIRSGFYFRISKGEARKSILMVDDIARLVPLLEQKGGIYNVCDDTPPSFRELETMICNQLGKKEPITIPYWMAKLFAIIGDYLGGKAPININKLNKLTQTLTFSNEKAKSILGWQPKSVLGNFKIDG